MSVNLQGQTAKANFHLSQTALISGNVFNDANGDKTKGVLVEFDTPERQKKFFDALNSLFPDYRLEEKEWNLGKKLWG